MREPIGTDGQMRLVTWSDFARHGKAYADALMAGESLVIFHNSQPFAIVRPVSPADIQITITETKGNPNR